MPAIPANGLLALFGPTGVGKTAVALALAQRLRAAGREPVAVSADALQVYDGLPILTGAATADEREVLDHRLVGIVPVTETFSAGRFAQLAHAEIDALLARGATPIVVGGTGLYLRAALTELDLRPVVPERLREHWAERLAAAGPDVLHAELAARAPWAAAEIDPHDAQRITRSLALDDLGALTPRSGPSALWTDRTRVPTRLVGLVRDREDLATRIDARVLAMVAAGAADEVRAADAAGASATARKALGFDHLLRGDVDGMQRDTRRYAKRQLTWMRKLAGVEVIDVTGREADAVAASILAAGPGA
jgi:tRNA dimethylallyltransferase